MSAGEVLATAGVAVGSLVLSVLGGLWLVPAILRAAARTGGAEADAAHAASAAPPLDHEVDAPAADAGTPDSPTSPAAVLALRGGTWIGVLERLAVTGCVLAGFAAGVAVIVAIKGLGRYPELRDNPGVSERFVVGTLASLVWAGFVGWLGLWALGHVG
ncbi:hypothetical protein [Luteimicrobium subarcticum]|uniref:Uncharacterized protein n=1 Tax=Luteimicrobium subarcticum TaxID=620910 RepID=A0A2M8W3V9_9MICO|nr:hypothetical protein [Luteimicrobium subarcticum]PJI85614.1 hypothetical protein CLV34_2797 [Luteimicrobium subarcticum]